MKYFVLFTSFNFDKSIWRTDEKQVMVIQENNAHTPKKSPQRVH